MNKAKHYTYRNLNAGGFSAKYKGIVKNRFGGTGKSPTGIVLQPEFRVSQKVSQKIKETGQRQVHAYVVSDSILTVTGKLHPITMDNLPTLVYHPKHHTEFHASDGSSLSAARGVIFMDNKAYIIPDDSRGDDAMNYILMLQSHLT